MTMYVPFIVYFILFITPQIKNSINNFIFRFNVTGKD